MQCHSVGLSGCCSNIQYRCLRASTMRGPREFHNFVGTPGSTAWNASEKAHRICTRTPPLGRRCHSPASLQTPELTSLFTGRSFTLVRLRIRLLLYLCGCCGPLQTFKVFCLLALFLRKFRWHVRYATLFRKRLTQRALVQRAVWNAAPTVGTLKENDGHCIDIHITGPLSQCSHCFPS